MNAADRPGPSTAVVGREVPGFDDLDPDRLRQRPGVKWARVGPDVLPAWVADMDFPAPAVVRDALRAYVDQGDLGYPDWPDGTPLRPLFARRMADRHGWDAAASRVREQSDLIQSVQIVLHLATAPGDAVAVQTPNYPPFLATLDTMDRKTVAVPTTDTDAGWRMDLAALADGVARHGCKALLLVNPHNPTGHVLTRDELQEIAAIARRHDLLVVSDEIHAELTHAPHRHIPFASLSPDAAARTVTLTSASKAFNVAGLRCMVTHYGPDRLLALRDAQPPELYGAVPVLGVVGTEAAWRHGDDWQRTLLAVLDRNRHRVRDTVAARLPAVRHHMPEGTYLAWLDAGRLALPKAPVETVLERGAVRLEGGDWFGASGSTCLRLNFATSARILDEVLDRVVAALAPLQP
ncbi:aminotransferase class I/II-fold pyridoxal phosphate-dependent enzyme [Streptomyces sp. NPDC006997]|uniref:MalY/PatB family protein n=1 Tax=Streptomyces sp. NPDC006997 TaxID=3155356 RepID=UPI0033F88A47